MTEAYTQDLPLAPYPGLRPFTKEEWPIFFGRESMTQDVITRLVKNHLVAVHGDSGCGKSSLIAAGVLPILENDQSRSGGQWTTCIMRPGDQPLSNLAKAIAGLKGAADQEHELSVRRVLNYGEEAPLRLAEMLGCSASQNVCILFDQFEELFEHARRHGPVEARLITAFLAGLVKAKPQGLHVILTMRSDYLGQCAQYQGFAEVVNETQYLVPRMERAALMRAIREPAQLFNGAVSAELADRLIADAGTGQDQLPLIQHGLMLLWRQKIAGLEEDANWALALDDYRSAGTLSQLLSNHADAILEKAAPSDEDNIIAENAFRALIDQNADGQAIRRRASFGELCAITGAEPGKLQAILRPFRAADASFLRPYGMDDLRDEDAVDVSHEAFLRNWQKITDPEDGWLIREMNEGQQWQSLKLAAKKFIKNQRQLLSAAAAEEGSEFLQLRSGVWASRHGGEFANVSKLIEESSLAALSAKRKDQTIIYAAITSAILMAGISGFSFLKWREANELRQALIEAQVAVGVINTETPDSPQMPLTDAQLEMLKGYLGKSGCPARGTMLSNYGEKGNGQKNEGVNIALPDNSPVLAINLGVVAYAGDELQGYGNLVLISHKEKSPPGPTGIVTAYAHLDRISVARGDRVDLGTVVGFAGQTGEVSSTQLHFEIRVGATATDPEVFLRSTGCIV